MLMNTYTKLSSHYICSCNFVVLPECEWQIITITGDLSSLNQKQEEASADSGDSKDKVAEDKDDKEDKTNEKKGENEDKDDKDKKEDSTEEQKQGEVADKAEAEDLERLPTPAPPTGQIVMVLYGDKGKTSEILLQSDKEGKFQVGQADDFDVSFKAMLLGCSKRNLSVVTYSH